MWTPQFIGITVGLFLIIVAIMGGGVEVKEIKIPRLSGWARFGSALLGAGIAMASSGFNYAETQASAYAATANQSADSAATNQAVPEAVEPEEAANSQVAETETEPEPELPPPPPPPAGYVTIIDRLAQGQEYERVAVSVNGETLGKLTVDPGQRMDRLQILADGREVRYYLDGTERGFQGEGLITRLEGRGTITLKPGAVFEVSLAEEQADPDDDVLDVDLFPVIEGADDADGG